MNTLQISRSPLGVATVEMVRPEVYNVFDEAMIAELTQAFDQLSADADVRVVVLAGRGKAFSAGADLQWMQRASQASFDWNLDDAQHFAAMLAGIAACPKPTIGCRGGRWAVAWGWPVPATSRWRATTRSSPSARRVSASCRR